MTGIGRLQIVLAAASAIAAVIALACSSGSSSSSPTSAPTTAAPARPSATVAASPAASTGATATPPASTVKIGDSSLGKVLTNASGMTLYTYNRDIAGSGQSTVSGGLLSAWPALTSTSDTPVAPAGLAGALATITRSDGPKQVTYKGLPLYLWQNDKAPGDVTGQGVAGFTIATP